MPMPDDAPLIAWPERPPPMAGAGPLIDVHGHFYHAECGRSDWAARNEARLRAGARMGITCHVASILGSWGYRSPVYFPSPADVTLGNTAMYRLVEEQGNRVRAYTVVNPNHTAHALAELQRGVESGTVGVKLLASRRADDRLLDPVAEFAVQHQLPMLHHAWQHRTRHWPSQDASDAVDLAALAHRHPRLTILLAHIGGGGDYQHTFEVARDAPHLLLELSGSGTDRGMLDRALEAVGAHRLIWGSDVTMETGLAKLHALDVIGLPPDELAAVRWGNAVRVFPPHAFPDAASLAAAPTREASR